jgi:predicted phage-related endonuclease
VGLAEEEGGRAMNFTVVNVTQRSDEWKQARCGRLTSSCADILFKEGRKKGEPSYQRRDLVIRLALEQMTGRSQDEDGYQSAAMQRGVDREADARVAYEAATGALVREAGFLQHTVHMAGTSLDGYVGQFDGVVELKVPKSATHIHYLESKEIPGDYIAQIRHHVWVTGAQWADFVSFDDRLPAHLQLVILRVTRDQLAIDLYEQAVLTLLNEVESKVKALGALRPVAA